MVYFYLNYFLNKWTFLIRSYFYSKKLCPCGVLLFLNDAVVFYFIFFKSCFVQEKNRALTHIRNYLQKDKQKKKTACIFLYLRNVIASQVHTYARSKTLIDQSAQLHHLRVGDLSKKIINEDGNVVFVERTLCFFQKYLMFNRC